MKFLEAAIRIELMNKAFAELCLTTWLRRLLFWKIKKVKGKSKPYSFYPELR